MCSSTRRPGCFGVFGLTVVQDSIRTLTPMLDHPGQHATETTVAGLSWYKVREVTSGVESAARLSDWNVAVTCRARIRKSAPRSTPLTQDA
jgi:hypothetical protein